MASQFRPLNLAADAGLRAYALGDLKATRFTGKCLKRHIVCLLNLCRHLRQTALPGRAAWRAEKKGARHSIPKLDYAEMCAEIEDLLQPTAVNYQIAKKTSWKTLMLVLVGLQHMTGYGEESSGKRPYQKCAERELERATEEGIKREIVIAKQHLDVFAGDWNAIPHTVNAILQLMQADLDGQDELDVDAVHDMIDTLPLPPGAYSRDEILRAERIARQRDLIDDDEFFDGPAPKAQLTEAIWQER